ncbi:MalY/PatB family protein [Intrasporangium sp. YIM S08009]|uniref:MalY/PatB family protein n=1 Tax=Intrasporangium zincisolvens TaxID=3080018 RepID=UPI002B056EDD|nr:aminotransferase class I/II-fold pyridoxal phosphate-dependent enzyme [Intrasporangium sp. YIM S08009]
MPGPILGASLDELRRDRTSVKWRRYDPDVLPLWIAEMDAQPCPAVVEAVGAAVQRGDTGYAWTVDYAEAFAEHAADTWGWRPDPGATVRVTDVLTGVTHLLGLLTDPGGPVVLTTPVYNAFFEVVEAAGRRVVEAPLGADLRLDLDSLAEAFATATAGGTRAVLLLSNPHNPTGTVHTADELAAVARLAEDHGVRVVSDEIHGALVYTSSTFTPYLTVPGTGRGIVVSSASKAWNLAGLKAAVIAPGPDAVSDVRRLHPFVTFGASHLGVVAHVAAWRHGREWLAHLLAELDANRALLSRLVTERLPGARLVVPEATYLAWLDLRGLGLGDRPATRLVDTARVALSDGPTFGSVGAGHARVNFATSPDILAEAIDRIAGSIA